MSMDAYWEGLLSPGTGTYVVRYNSRLNLEPRTYSCTADGPTHAVHMLKGDLEIGAQEQGEIHVIDVSRVGVRYAPNARFQLGRAARRLVDRHSSACPVCSNGKGDVCVGCAP